MRFFRRASSPELSLLADDKALDGTLPLDSVDVPRGRSPIQSVVIAGNERSLFVAESLRALGFDARAIRKPTVQEGTERLRITLHAYNTDAEVGRVKGEIVVLAPSPYMHCGLLSQGGNYSRLPHTGMFNRTDRL